MLETDFVAIALSSNQMATRGVSLSICTACRPIFRFIALAALGSTF